MAVKKATTKKSRRIKFEEVVDVITKTKKQLAKTKTSKKNSPSKLTKKQMDEMVVNNYPLVAFIAKRFFIKNGEPMEDLMQVGSVGLIKAVKNFDPSLGSKLSTFAVPVIEGEIRHYLRDKANTVRIPRKYMETNTKIKNFKHKYQIENGVEPTNEIIAEHLKIEKDFVDETISNINSMYTVPLEYNSIVDRKSRETLSHTENIIGTKSAADVILEREGLQEALELLPQRERDIVYDHFFRELGQKELAVIYNTSQAYISRLIKKSCETLKVALEGSNHCF